jgi:predicted AAA+ superfamily ATPase
MGLNLANQTDFLQISNVKVDQLIGYEAQRETLKQVIRHSIDEGESSTVLVYGGRGMGKSTLGNHHQPLFDRLNKSN